MALKSFCNNCQHLPKSKYIGSTNMILGYDILLFRSQDYHTLKYSNESYYTKVNFKTRSYFRSNYRPPMKLGKVIFSQTYVSHSFQRGRYLWYLVPFRGLGMGVDISRGWVCPGGGYVQGRDMDTNAPDMGYSTIRAGGRYTSYWNAFVLLLEGSECKSK